MKKRILTTLLVLQLIFTFSCSSDSNSDDAETNDTVEVVFDDTDFEATYWTEDTHSKNADPNFDEVFEDNAVKRLDIVITEDRWNSMLENMTSLYGTFGSRSNATVSSSDEDPIFVPGEVFYNGIEWYRVGIRFKGNSSLQSSWSAGILKLSFKLDFDEFEDDYPQIDNQRFYGFKKLSLKNNYDDKSMLREKVAADVFRDAGLAVSHTAFYTVYVDHGDGPEYFGVYTLVEEVDDTVIDTQFTDNDGNLYKPDGDSASFTEGSFTEADFVKKTNEDEADYTDIEDLFAALHATNRTTDPEAWRDNLETILDTDTFLKYLAVNTVIQNWDTYGRMTHNYFLYNNPDTARLSWIPWDNNEALKDGNGRGAVALDFSDVNATSWPLIGYLYADSTYKAKYNTYVQETIDDYFNISKMQSKYATYSSLIEPYATSEMDGYTFLNSSSDFQVAVSALHSHVVERAAVANTYLSK
ncbi:spore coat protein [Formosa sediminum]|uniref:Spore coat protein n=1 Tax=Formosa sediminum TaxID=2594004 RepID=A0A516GTU3_9FLAO|nr:CotH kinase family protein [Formosa sediminum]QDO94946.1 spore coat protein [Formosa sediminum]